MNKDITPTGIGTSQPVHTLTLKIEEEYMIAKAAGSRTRIVVATLVKEIAQAARENQRGKVLIDVRELEGWLGVFDSYYIVTKDFQRLRGKGIKKVAIIDRPLPKMREKFFETVSNNRGFNLRIFENPETALDWLLVPNDAAGKPK
ncbi:MAG: hypothetical protein ABSG01_02170 [Anaerolineales bacterium]|jgi:hypothetical protein